MADLRKIMKAKPPRSVDRIKIHTYRGRNPDGHDSLHMQEGLKFCWCMCQRCWQRLPSSPSGAGKCICPQCPCNTRT